MCPVCKKGLLIRRAHLSATPAQYAAPPNSIPQPARWYTSLLFGIGLGIGLSTLIAFVIVFAWFAPTRPNHAHTESVPSTKEVEEKNPALAEKPDWQRLPVRDEKAAVISAGKGGKLEFADGSGVRFPPGALPADTKVLLRRRAVPRSHARLATVTEVDIGDTTLLAEATLTLPLPQFDPDGHGDYKVYRIHQGAQTEVPAKLHPYRRQIQVRTRGFSDYLVWDPGLRTAVQEDPLLWLDPHGAHRKYWAIFIFHSPGKTDTPVYFDQFTAEFDQTPANQASLANQVLVRTENVGESIPKDTLYRNIGFSELPNGADVHGYRVSQNVPSSRQFCGGLAIAPLAGGPYIFPTKKLWAAVRDHATLFDRPRPWDLILFSRDTPVRADGENLGHYALVESVEPGVKIITKNQIEKIYRGPLSGFGAMAQNIIGSNNNAVTSYYRLDWDTVQVRKGPSLDLKLDPQATVVAGQRIRGELKVKVRHLPRELAPGNVLRVKLFLQAGAVDAWGGVQDGVMVDVEKDLTIDLNPTKTAPDPDFPLAFKAQEFTFNLEELPPLEIPTDEHWLTWHAPYGRVPVVVSGYFVKEKLDDGRLMREFESPQEEINVERPSQLQDRARPIVKDIVKRLDEAKAKAGELEIALVWFNKNDLDLYVVPPTGEEIYYGHRRSRCGGQLDLDMNVDYATASPRPVEHVVWPKTPPVGKYKVFVHHYRNHKRPGCEDPSRFAVTVKAQGRTFLYNGQVTFGEPKRLVVEFTLDKTGVVIPSVRPAP
jgi:hypothetical protein